MAGKNIRLGATAEVTKVEISKNALKQLEQGLIIGGQEIGFSKEAIKSLVGNVSSRAGRETSKILESFTNNIEKATISYLKDGLFRISSLISGQGGVFHRLNINAKKSGMGLVATSSELMSSTYPTSSVSYKDVQSKLSMIQKYEKELAQTGFGQVGRPTKEALQVSTTLRNLREEYKAQKENLGLEQQLALSKKEAEAQQKRILELAKEKQKIAEKEAERAKKEEEQANRLAEKEAEQLSRLIEKEEIRSQKEKERIINARDYKTAQNALSQISKLEREMASWPEGRVKASTRKDFETRIQMFEEELSLAKQNLTIDQKRNLEVKERNREIASLIAKGKEENRLNESAGRKGGFFARFKETFGRVFDYGIAYKAQQLLLNTIRSAFDSLKRYDTAMVNIRMITGDATKTIEEQRRAVKNLAISYTKLAQELGTTAAAVMESSDIWLRQGRSIEETNELIKATMVLATVANVNSAQSADMLTSIINSFKLSAEQAMYVVDALSAVDLKAAVSTQELAEALQQSSAVAQLAGVSFESLTGYIGAVSQATRLSASTIGNAYKTIFSRMQAVKLGEAVDSESGESVSDVEKALKMVNISLRDSADSFRSVDDVLGDVASRWKTLNDIEKSSIAMAIAGVRQRNIFVSLMDNWNDALYLSAVALNSEGTAMQKHAVFMDSYQAKMNSMTAAWEKFINSRANLGLLTGAIDVATGALGIMEKAGLGVLDVMTALAAVFSLAKLSKVGDFGFTKMVEQTRKVAELDKTTGLMKNVGDIETVKKFSAKGTGQTIASAVAWGAIAYELAGVISGAIQHFIIGDRDVLARGEKQVENIGKQIDEAFAKSNAKVIKENYSLFREITDYQNSGEELSGDMLKELVLIKETLKEQLGLEKSVADLTEKDISDAVANMRVDASALSGLNALKEQQDAIGFKALGIGVDKANLWTNIAQGAAAGAGAGIAIGSKIDPLWGSIIGGVGAGLVGGIVGAIKGSKDQVIEIGEKLTLGEAIKQSEESLKEFRKTATSQDDLITAEEFEKQLTRMKDVQADMDENINKYREQFKGVYGSQIELAKRGYGNLSSGEVGILQLIGDEIAKDMTVEQMLDPEYSDKISANILRLAEEMSKEGVSYADLQSRLGELIPEVAKNSEVFDKVKTALEVSAPNVTRAIADLRKALEDASKSVQKNITDLTLGGELQASLMTVGIAEELSTEDLRKLVGLKDGKFDASVIASPEMRKYVERLIALEEERKGTEETIFRTQEQINEEYKAKVELLNKEYKILEKQEEILKKQEAVESARKQRDTLVWRNGRFQYEADPMALAQLEEEANQLQTAINQLRVQQEIDEKLAEQIAIQQAQLNAITNFRERVATGIEIGDKEYFQELAKMLSSNLGDNGVIDTKTESGKVAKTFLDMILGLGEELFNSLMNSGLLGNLKIDFTTGKISGSYDSGGLLKGKGLFFKDTAKDEVVLSPKDAPRILGMLRNTGRLEESVNGAERLLGRISSRKFDTEFLLNKGNSANGPIYNIDTVLVEEANDIDQLLSSVYQKTRKGSLVGG